MKLQQTFFIEAGWKDYADDFVSPPSDTEVVHITQAALQKLQEMAFFAGAHHALITTYSAGGKFETIDGQEVRSYGSDDVERVMKSLEASLTETRGKAREYSLLFSEMVGSGLN